MSPHAPVLSEEVASLFERINEGLIVDCTLGYGGHAEKLLERRSRINYIGIDRDQKALDYSTARLAKFADRFRAIKAAFADAILTIKEPIAGVLADLGVSSPQLDDRDRGFGFNSPSLDMRMDQSARFSAADIVNGCDESELSRLLFEYGEERAANKIAALIVQNRPFYSAKTLSDLIAARLPRGRIHAATLTFQAIRIKVNDELKQLDSLLSALEIAKPKGAVVCVISFHSLEDRVVKSRFKRWARRCVCPPTAWRCECGGACELGEILTAKPIIADASETRSNPRSRSAKLRGFLFKDAYIL
ncbi:MAG: 16S rRNA (cytosine(1402)-N(4))-methyltransferase RsmH [Helicobacteraceae bacterium]|jgi:16S rRNA (cytosine1402-N4)-methyltransferase|nr:16S rRNA (cytosine(1402)-N(4))-methyltransferase RsmH [Helicobacteraceae bacterium]